MSRASSLHRLQTLDSETDRCRERLAEIEFLLGGSKAVDDQRACLAEAAARLQAARSASKVAEHALASHRTKLEEAERALYGGSVRNPKELQDLQAEVDGFRRHLPTLEDHVLDAMVAVEEAELVHQAATDELDRLLGLEASRNQALVEEQTGLRKQVERLQAEREAALGDVSPEDLATYSRLRETRGGLAVALLQDDTCGACGLTQSRSLGQTIRMGSELTRCKQCGRILYSG
jgi:hypothetical protein